MSSSPVTGFPLVSVFCPTYNQEQFVAEALVGILAQDYPHLEIVVPDDGSTDNTTDVVREYAAKSPHPIRLLAGDHVGITGNCNRGLLACVGKYVAFTAGDDVLLPGKISAQVRWLEASERRVLCGHDVEAFDSDTGKRLFLWSDRYPHVGGRGAERAVETVPFCGTAMMVRRSAIPATGYDSRLPILSDWKLWIDCLYPDGEFGCVEGVLARYRRHPKNITNTEDPAHARRIFAELMMLFALVGAEYPALMPACRRARAGHLLAQGNGRRKAGDLSGASAYIAQSLHDSPVRVASLLIRQAARFVRGRRGK